MKRRKIEIMDTTLRDGEQTSGVSFSVSEIKHVIHLATSKNMLTNVYLEDWSNGMRNSPAYVYQMLDFLSTQPVKRILLPDTLGILTPCETFTFIKDIKSKYPGIHFDFH